MKWYAEITQWPDATRNGIYLLNESRSKMYAFRSAVTKKITVFRKPIAIDIRGRKFQLNSTQFRVSVEVEPQPGRSWQVQGSRGDQYTVTEHLGQWQCSCAGFKFRGQCRHVIDLRDQKPLTQA